MLGLSAKKFSGVNVRPSFLTGILGDLQNKTAMPSFMTLTLANLQDEVCASCLEYVCVMIRHDDLQ